MSWPRAIKMLLALKCDESTRIISDGFERDLTSLEKWSVRLHFISCGVCRRFKKHLQYVHQQMERRAQLTTPLSPEARERIARRIQER